MTEQELDRLEALAAAATAGPWYRAGYSVRNGHQEDDVIASVEGPSPAYMYDGEFIAASREAVPALVAAVRERDAWLGRFAADSDQYRLGQEAERAAVLRDAADAGERARRGWDDPYQSSPGEVVADLIAACAEARGQAAPMPHDELRARHDRMEATLRGIAAHCEGRGLVAGVDVIRMTQEALEGDA